VRDQFVKLLIAAAQANKDIFLVTGDLGFGVLDRFEADCPNQYINAGVAEQHMMGLAAGLASSGKKVFVYSIANFPTFRCLEQLRNDVSYHDLDVTVIAVGAGFSYGSLGYSHFALEDISIMRALPRMKIYNPANSKELDSVFHECMERSGPKYIRLDKNSGIDSPVVFDDKSSLLPYVVSGQSEVAIITSGTLLTEAVKASELLKRVDLFIDVYSLPRIWPFVEYERLKLYDMIFAVEEHSKFGGLFSIISEIIVSNSIETTVVSVAAREDLLGSVGSQDYLRKIHGLDSQTIATKIGKLRENH
jgi:transketolase